MRETRPRQGDYLDYYGKYVVVVRDGDIVETLRAQLADTVALFRGISEEGAGHRYAEGKWTIRQVVGHLCDVERVMAYRALSFARADTTQLPGFEENDWAETAGSDERSLSSLIEELHAVRASTIALFGGFPAESWSRTGKANNAQVTVRALAWIIAGHELHHCRIIRERYLAPEARVQPI